MLDELGDLPGLERRREEKLRRLRQAGDFCTVHNRIDAADLATMARISAASSPVLDRFLPALSRAADFGVLWLGIAAALAARKGERGRRAALRGLASAEIAGTASNVLAKSLARRARPAGEVPRSRRPGRRPVTSSFPSGHAASSVAFATGVGLELPALAAPAGALAAATGMARVVNGVHFPSDIAGGFLLGVGVGMLSRRWWPLGQPEPAAVARPRHEAPEAQPETDSYQGPR